MPYNLTSFGSLRTDYSKKISLGMEYSYDYGGDISLVRYQLSPGITLRPFRSVKISISANYENIFNDLQYITALDYQYDKRYILGALDQTTFGLTFRMNLNLTPEFSIQYYGSPFISRGSYNEYKYVTNPSGESYSDRFKIYDNVILTDLMRIVMAPQIIQLEIRTLIFISYVQIL
jgi:hypothetical protein